MGEIIYEKHFHKETIEELEKERIDLVEAFGEDAKQAPSFNEIMKMIYSNVSNIPCLAGTRENGANFHRNSHRNLK